VLPLDGKPWSMSSPAQPFDNWKVTMSATPEDG
jgi:hypothetical protein